MADVVTRALGWMHANDFEAELLQRGDVREPGPGDGTGLLLFPTWRTSGRPPSRGRRRWGARSSPSAPWGDASASASDERPRRSPVAAPMRTPRPQFVPNRAGRAHNRGGNLGDRRSRGDGGGFDPTVEARRRDSGRRRADVKFHGYSCVKAAGPFWSGRVVGQDEPKAGRLRCWIRGVGFGNNAPVSEDDFEIFLGSIYILASPRDQKAHTHTHTRSLGPKPRSHVCAEDARRRDRRPDREDDGGGEPLRRRRGRHVRGRSPASRCRSRGASRRRTRRGRTARPGRRPPSEGFAPPASRCVSGAQAFVCEPPRKREGGGSPTRRLSVLRSEEAQGHGRGSPTTKLLRGRTRRGFVLFLDPSPETRAERRAGGLERERESAGGRPGALRLEELQVACSCASVMPQRVWPKKAAVPRRGVLRCLSGPRTAPNDRRGGGRTGSGRRAPPPTRSRTRTPRRCSRRSRTRARR